MTDKKGKILIIEDNAELKDVLSGVIEEEGYEVASFLCAEKAVEYFRQYNGEISLVLSDIQMPKLSGIDLFRGFKKINKNIPFILMTAFANIENAVEMMKEGVVDYLEKPFDLKVLLSTIEMYALPYKLNNEELIINDKESKKLYEVAKKVAKNDIPVFLNGESGVGKELWAKFIHDNSEYSKGNFVPINCAAISENMLEAILFGYEKGAFTGAHKSFPGKFEQADGGTIFLDEITEMDIDLQSKLLRVLQDKTVERLGSTKSKKLNVRIISASNRNLLEAVEQGRLREDIYFRINVFPLNISPLRERKNDIEAIVSKILKTKGNKVLSQKAKDKLLSYSFPGNVRELINIIERAIVLSVGNIIEEDDIFFDDIKCQKNVVGSIESIAELKKIELDFYFNTLKKFSGNRQKAAEHLKISKRTLQNRVKELKENGYDI